MYVCVCVYIYIYIYIWAAQERVPFCVAFLILLKRTWRELTRDKARAETAVAFSQSNHDCNFPFPFPFPFPLPFARKIEPGITLLLVVSGSLSLSLSLSLAIVFALIGRDLPLSRALAVRSTRIRLCVAFEEQRTAPPCTDRQLVWLPRRPDRLGATIASSFIGTSTLIYRNYIFKSLPELKLSISFIFRTFIFFVFSRRRSARSLGRTRSSPCSSPGSTGTWTCRRSPCRTAPASASSWR